MLRGNPNNLCLLPRCNDAPVREPRYHHGCKTAQPLVQLERVSEATIHRDQKVALASTTLTPLARSVNSVFILKHPFCNSFGGSKPRLPGTGLHAVRSEPPDGRITRNEQRGRSLRSQHSTTLAPTTPLISC